VLLGGEATEKVTLHQFSSFLDNEFGEFDPNLSNYHFLSNYLIYLGQKIKMFQCEILRGCEDLSIGMVRRANAFKFPDFVGFRRGVYKGYSCLTSKQAFFCVLRTSVLVAGMIL